MTIRLQTLIIIITLHPTVKLNTTFKGNKLTIFNTIYCCLKNFLYILHIYLIIERNIFINNRRVLAVLRNLQVF